MDLDVSDPDGNITSAAWYDVSRAVGLLRQLPYAPIAVPVIDYLATGDERVRHWHSPSAEAEPEVTRTD